MPARRATAVGPDGSPLPTEGGKEKLTFGCAYPGCGQTYSRMEYLKRHQRKHQDERPFQCKDCSKAFARSDVLLRHRRRCHPTPPPRDRSSNSPKPPLRAHPSVPISSSRTSEREASPVRGGRKHPRSSEAATLDEHVASRPRLSPDEDDDEDRYGSRFSRNGMGNGGVFGVADSYYTGNPVSTDANYGASSLLPMFQNSSYHNVHDPNHLEDASVLLSMAYPGGVPGPNTSPDDAGNGERSEWDAGQSLGGVLTAEDTAAAVVAAAAASVASVPSASPDNDTPSHESNFSSGAVDTPARPAAPGAVLPESMGNLAGNMNWLAGTNQAISPSNWPAEPSRPLSPFNLSSLFATSPFGLSPSPGVTLSNETTAMAIAAVTAAADDQSGNNNNNNNNNNNTGANTTVVTLNGNNSNSTLNSNYAMNSAFAQANPFVAALLNQLAMNDVPETKANPNPERPLLRLANKDLNIRAGQECPRNSRFYLPADRFAGCYQIPHWALPPLRSLSVMAAKTYYSVLNHFPFVHDPTFQLIDTAACLAFAICTVGGIRMGGKSGKSELFPNDPLSAGGAWEGVFTNFTIPVDEEEQEDQRRVEEWDGGQIVRHEKTNMLVKSFSLAKGVLMTEYNVALLQALILYHAPYFLSKNEHERRHANMFLGTIVSITRQIGFFQPELEHTDPNFELPQAPYNPVELDRAWRRWVQLESRRRTAFLVYHLDTVSSIESQFPPIIAPSEIAMLPLPASNSIWNARTPQEWIKAMHTTYRPLTLDSAMRRLFNLPTSGRFDEVAGTNPTRNILSEVEYGPFARTALIMTLLRGIVDVGEGKRDRGDWRDLTDLWVSAQHLRPGAKCFTAEGMDLGTCTPEALRTRYSFALQRWRDGWENDKLCSPIPRSPSSSSPDSVLLTPTLNAASPSSSSSGGTSKKGAHVYCEEAMPFYFLSTALLRTLLNNSSQSAGRNLLANVRYSELLDASRTLARSGSS